MLCVLKIITFRFTLNYNISFYNSLTFRFGGLSTYLEQLNVLLNPVKKELLNPVKTEKPTAADRASNSDVMLYMEQQMAKVETFCKQQAAQSSGINLLHYNDLLRQIKVIRERRETAK